MCAGMGGGDFFSRAETPPSSDFATVALEQRSFLEDPYLGILRRLYGMERGQKPEMWKTYGKPNGKTTPGKKWPKYGQKKDFRGSFDSLGPFLHLSGLAQKALIMPKKASMRAPFPWL